VEENVGHADVVVRHRLVQRVVAVAVLRVHVGALLDEQLHHPGVALRCGEVQDGPRVEVARVYVQPLLEQLLHSLALRCGQHHLVHDLG
jgi:hypothetical protein